MSQYKVKAFALAALPHFPALKYSDFGAGIQWNTSWCDVPDNSGALSCLSGTGQSAFNLQAPAVCKYTQPLRHLISRGASGRMLFSDGEFQSWACVNRSDERPPDEGCASGYGIAPILRDRFG